MNSELLQSKYSVTLMDWMSTRPGAFERAGLLQNSAQSLTLSDLERMFSYDSYSGKSVSERSAMCVSAVYACVALIAGAVSTLPAKIYQRTEEGPERVSHPYRWMLNERACANFSSAQMWEYAMWSLLMAGDAFVYIERGFNGSGRSDVKALRPIHPDCVFVDYVESAAESERLIYRMSGAPKGIPSAVPAEDMLHFSGLGFDGRRGMSIIRYAARQSVGNALAQEEHSGRFFSNGARPDFVLKAPGKLDAEQIKALRTSFERVHGGSARSHVPAILTNGLELQEISMNAEDAQLIQTRGFQVEDICRFFGVPPHMIGHTDKASSWGSGVENMGRGFTKFTLSRYLVKMQQEINHKFWPMREKYFMEFDPAGLERGDLKSENESLRIALGRAGEPSWMTVNEVRKIKNLPPIEGGDVMASNAALQEQQQPQ
jgi:HK97 family phage portal protein